MLLPLPILFVSQSALNFAIKNDEGTQRSLAAINGKVICLSVLQPAVKIYLLIVDNHIELSREFDGELDATLEGTVGALLSLQKGNDALYRKEVSITGDLHAANELKAIVTNVDLDFEELLSGFTGDTVAHQLGRVGRGLSAWLGDTNGSLQQNVSEYFQEEAQFLAPNSEVSRFCNEVDELRTQYDRLNARIQQLELKQQ